MTEKSVMHGHYVKSVWEDDAGHDLGLLPSTHHESKQKADEDLPPRHLLRWGVVLFCTAFWTGVIGLALVIF